MNHIEPTNQFETEFVMAFNSGIFRSTVNTVIGLGAPKADADDIASEALCRAWECQRQLRDEARLQWWIKRIATNLWIDLQRSRRLPLLPSDGLELVAAPNVNLSGVIDVEIVLARCSERQRTLLRRIYLNEEPLAEVAQSLSISVDALHHRLSRARRSLHRILSNTR